MPERKTATTLELDARDLELSLEAGADLARRYFRSFRKLMRPDMLENWWTDEIAAHLQQFYRNLVAGRRPKLALMTGPQHGKSWAATDFAAWVAGQNPDLKIIFAAYSEDLGRRTNRWMQRMLTSGEYRFTFGKVNVGKPGWECNSELIEFPDYAGSFRNTTVQGPINGMELNLGIIDDPVKGRQEANSKSIRDSTWNWYNDDFLSRFSANAGMLCIMTRWHVDDLLGRALERQKDWKVLRYPAVAEQDERHRKKGQALFPELKPLDFLLQRKAELSEGSWQALYQQSPIIVGGGAIPIEKLRLLPNWQRSGNKDIKRSVRYIDKGGSQDEGSYTAGVLMHKMQNGTFVISHIFRGQWSALEREQKIRLYCDADKKLLKTSYEVVIEQEPGSGGKESAENTIRMLAGMKVTADKVTGSKEVRAEPFVAQCQGDNVRLVGDGWYHAFIDECETWPAGKYKDQVDAAAGAFNTLTKGYGYDSTYAAWQPGFVDYDRR